METAVSIGEVIAVGPHRVVCESDLYIITFIGDISAEHALQFDRLNRRYHAQQGYLMCLADAQRAGTMSPETRKLAARLSREIACPGATAIFGANLITRAVATLILKAISLTAQKESVFSFFRAEPEARSWLDEQRPLLLARRTYCH